MKVVIIGNIGVGKTTISQIIKDNWKNAEILSIDNIRNSFGDGTIEKENYCKQKFIESITFNDSLQIIELTGVGILGEKLFSLLNNYNYSILVIYLFVTEIEIYKRIKNRKWETPFHLGSDKVPEAISHTDQEYNNGLLDRFMNACKSGVYISLYNDKNNLSRNSIYIKKMVKLLMKR
jgi:broad-specificity NMP kinase